MKKYKKKILKILVLLYCTEKYYKERLKNYVFLKPWKEWQYYTFLENRGFQTKIEGMMWLTRELDILKMRKASTILIF